MKLTNLAMCAALLLVALCMPIKADDPNEALTGVIDLTPDNFDEYVNGGKHALVEFYAPWCGHCKRMVPELKALGAAVASDPALSSRVVIGKVDADKHRELGTRFGVSGFPTIKWFTRGEKVSEPSDYNSARSKDAFLTFINEKLQADKGHARVESLDAVAAKFVEAGADGKKLMKEAEAALKKLEGDAKKNGELYIKFMTKALDKGMDYFKSETDRLERMVKGGAASQTKVQEMLRKLSVLSAFVDEDVEADEE